jgi:hypothetical protein
MRVRALTHAYLGMLLAALLLVPFFDAPAKAVATLIQAQTGLTNGGTTVSATLGPSATAGNLLIVVCGARDSVTITGPGGFSTAINQTGTPSQAIFYKAASGGESTISCTSSASTRLGMLTYEYSGMVTVSPLDAVNTTASTGTSMSPSSGSITTTTVNTLLIGAVTTQANTSFSSWSNSFTQLSGVVNGGQASLRTTYGAASREESATGTYSTTATAGASGAWRGQIAAFKVIAPLLSVGIVDAGGSPVTAPAVPFNALNSMLLCQTSTATLGTVSEKVRVSNTTANGNWTLSIAATGGSGTVWSNGSATYDYNDGTGQPSLCLDGADSDTKAGQLTIDASASTIAPQSGCSAAGIAKSSSTSFSEGSVDTINLLSASSSQTSCYFDITGIGLSQRVPGETPASGSSYVINLTLTTTAN